MRSGVSLKAICLSSVEVFASKGPEPSVRRSEFIVMMHHRLAVGGELHIGLDAEIA